MKMKNSHDFDKFLRNEINSIDYDGADQAWESFASGVGADVLMYNGKKNYISLTRYLSLALIFFGCLGLYAFVNFDNVEDTSFQDREIKTIQNNLIQPVSPSKIELRRPVDPVNEESNKVNGPTDVVPSVTPNVNVAPSGPMASMVLPVEKEEEIVTTIASLSNPVPQNRKLLVNNTANNTELIVTQSTLAAQVANQDNTPAELENIPSLPMLALENMEYDHRPLMGKFGQVLIPIKKRSIRIFGEVGISNQNAGVKLLAGISVPLANTVDVEFGAGINSRIGDSDIFTFNFQSQELPNYEAEHTYAFSQLINFMAPVRIKKQFKKHSVLVGGKIVRNVTNSVKLNTSTPYRSFASGNSDIKIADVTYFYQNSRTSVNNYSVVSSPEWNFELTGGYEYQAGRFGIGVQVSKPVAPSFKLFSKQDANVIYQAKTPFNFGVNLKYYI